MMVRCCTTMLLAVAFMTGCAPAKQGQINEEPPQDYQNAFLAYRNCVADGAEQLASAIATPYQIADAALAGCEQEANAYKRIVQDHFISLVSPRSLSMALSRADQKAAETREMLRGMAIRMVVKNRVPE